jgi:hypothetical protein
VIVVTVQTVIDGVLAAAMGAPLQQSQLTQQHSMVRQGNAATGNTNPLDFTVTAPTQTISSIFGPTPTNWSALTILINGSGHVSRNPFANDYTNTQTVLLTAIPDNGQSFLGWSGDASGTQNPLSLAMSQSRVVTANFSGRPQLRPDGLSASGFRLTLLTPPTNTWQILGSTNESSWQVLGTVTNTQGEIDFLDAAATTLRTRVYRADRFLGPP